MLHKSRVTTLWCCLFFFFFTKELCVFLHTVISVIISILTNPGEKRSPTPATPSFRNQVCEAGKAGLRSNNINPY